MKVSGSLLKEKFCYNQTILEIPPIYMITLEINLECESTENK